jgi:hypothetical protein
VAERQAICFFDPRATPGKGLARRLAGG